MSEDRGPQIGRLAMRHEGEYWNAYYAMADTLDGSILLGSIRMGVVANQERRDAFMGLMREVVGDIIQDVVGVRPIWGSEQTAPEHERSGHG